MKIRSLLELEEAISAELSWRKKEIYTFSLLIKKLRDHEKAILLRTAVPILYAHWEGFVKNAATFYLQYVSRKKLKYKDLESNFVALACKAALQESLKSNKILLLRQVVDFINLNKEETARVPYQDVVDTASNLNSDVLKNIIHQVGIPYEDHYLTKELVIDGKLLKSRNEVAHGEKVEVSESDFSELHTLVTDLLELFRTDLQNAAATEMYKIKGA